ncbi:MAG: hypothetical protein VXW29_16720, partial [SAR324 cluster bacterium]|nr:hypothetical protein [SAR324 cluster bacterium]
IVPERMAELTDCFLCFALLRIAKRYHLKAKALQHVADLVGSGERRRAISGILITSVFYYQSLLVDLTGKIIFRISNILLLSRG